MKRKLVSDSLNEYVHPGVGGYSLDQLERDYHKIMDETWPEVDEDIKMDFLMGEIGPLFHRGFITNIDQLREFIMGNIGDFIERNY